MITPQQAAALVVQHKAARAAGNSKLERSLAEQIWAYQKVARAKASAPAYRNEPVGGYAPQQDTFTPATGFKRKQERPNKPTGGGERIAPDTSQALRISARPDLAQFIPDASAYYGAQQQPQMLPMTNVRPKAASQPKAVANALRAIEGPQNG